MLKVLILVIFFVTFGACENSICRKLPSLCQKCNLLRDCRPLLDGLSHDSLNGCETELEACLRDMTERHGALEKRLPAGGTFFLLLKKIFPIFNERVIPNIPRGKLRQTGLGSEFLGKRSEFLGKRSEFLGKRSEFLGKRPELLGKRSEFLGKKNELLGKRSEMLGKRSEFLGKRSEFLGKRSNSNIEELLNGYLEKLRIEKSATYPTPTVEDRRKLLSFYVNRKNQGEPLEENADYSRLIYDTGTSKESQNTYEEKSTEDSEESAEKKTIGPYWMTPRKKVQGSEYLGKPYEIQNDLKTIDKMASTIDGSNSFDSNGRYSRSILLNKFKQKKPNKHNFLKKKHAGKN